MKHKKRNLFLATMVSLAVSSNGATLFTENFSDNSASPNMALGTGHGSPTTDFTGDFTVTSGTGSRIYLGTNDTNYNTIDFTFEADVTYVNNNAWGIAFFGMGSSNANTSQFGEPTAGPVIAMALRTDDTGGLGNVTGRDNSPAGSNQGITGMTIGLPSTHGMRMDWNATTMLATFMFDLDNDGTYEPARTFTLNGADNGFTASNSRLFVGGGFGVTFDNISVISPIPEPSAALLGGLGVLGLLRRRRM